MPTYFDLNSTLHGEKIYCVYERSRGPRLVSTKGRHNAQGLTVEGNPAIAVIVKSLRFVKE